MRWALLTILLLALVGCQSEKSSSSEGTDTKGGYGTSADGSNTKGPMMGSTQPDPQEEAQLTALQKEHDSAKTTFETKKDNKSKEAYVNATVALANATMTANSLGPREKYPSALRLFREALKVDPKNEVAQKNKDLIEKIYTDMGRPIPE